MKGKQCSLRVSVSTLLLPVPLSASVSTGAQLYQSSSTEERFFGNPPGLQHQIETAKASSLVNCAATGFFASLVHRQPLLDNPDWVMYVNPTYAFVIFILSVLLL